MMPTNSVHNKITYVLFHIIADLWSVKVSLTNYISFLTILSGSS